MTLLAAFAATLLSIDALLYALYVGIGPALIWLALVAVVIAKGRADAKAL